MFSLSLENFRGFKSENFKFSKINVLIGENSSGKSSLFKLILALKQTIQSPMNREINLGFTGEFSDLGSYRESVYYQQENLDIKFKFSVIKNYESFFLDQFLKDDSPSDIQEREKLRIKKFIGKDITTFTDLEYTLTKDLHIHSSIKTSIKNPSLGELSIEFPNREDDDFLEKNLIYGPRCNVQYHDYELNKTFAIGDVQYEKDGFMTIIIGPSLHSTLRKLMHISDAVYFENPASDDDAAKINLVETVFHRAAYLLITQNFVKYYLDKVDYINPIFTRPSRVYLYRDIKKSSKIRDIEDVVEFFSGTSEVSKAAFSDFVKILQEFGIADNIEVIKDERLPVRELRVKIQDLLSNITDVGYGVSLQLPIILKALLSERIRSRRNSVILIEQPEVHLHPKLHAQLIEILLSLSKYTTYFVETHSEHIIRKLQVLVKEKKYGLSPEDITIHYLKRINKKTEVTNHRILSSGLLEPNLPSDFFDNSYLLAKELLD